MYDLIQTISSFVYFVYNDIITIFVHCRYYDDESYETKVLNNTVTHFETSWQSFV